MGYFQPFKGLKCDFPKDQVLNLKRALKKASSDANAQEEKTWM